MPFSGGLGSWSRAGVVQGMHGGRSAAQRPDAGAGCRRPPEPSPAAPAGRGDSLRSRFLRRLRAALARAGRRSLPAALLLALALPAAVLPLAVPAAAQEVVEVPRAWPLKPSGLSATQKEFRLLFVTSTGRNATSMNIADYNSFVQGRAAAGHVSVRFSSSGFRVVGSTASVDARDNTSTTYTASAKGVPIYWLSGGKVADQYEDFYDGSWDTKNFSAGRNEFGSQFPGNDRIFTGSNNNGTASSQPLGHTINQPVTGFRMQNPGTLSVNTFSRTASLSLLGLSPVFKVTDSVKGSSASITSTPANANFGYFAGETIRVQVDFGEAVTVTGSPYLVLDVGGQARRAAYESGSGTRHLVFAYGVARGDTDADGVSLCSDTMMDANCGRIALDGGSIVAQSDSLAAELDLPELGNQGRHKVHAAAPRARGLTIASTPANADFGYFAGETIRVQVDFAEAVTVTGSPYLLLDVGGQARRAAYESGSGTRHLVFAYGVVRGETDANGVSLCSDTMMDANCGRIALDGGSIVAQSDSFAAELDLPNLGNQGRHKVDGTPTRVRGLTITSTPANATPGYGAGETIRVQLDFAEAVSVLAVQGTPSVVLNIGRAVRRAVYASGSGTRHLDFEYPVQAGDFDSDGISLCSDTFLDRGCGRISLNGGSISAQSDSLAVELDLPALGNQSGHKVDATPVFVPTPGVGGPMPNPSMGTVPAGWPLKPAGAGRGPFRLLFATPTRDATSADINVYNRHAIDAAGTGHSAIRAFKNGFRVIASTGAVDARDNAGLTGTAVVPIYWMGSGNKVADNYADLLDGSWDSENPTNAAGNASSVQFFWTGSGDDGTEGTLGSVSVALGTDEGTIKAAFGALNVSTSGDNPLRAGLSSLGTLSALYALSQVLMVAPPEMNTSTGASVGSQPGSGDTYRAGETIALLVPFTEPVRVLGAPSFALTLGSTVVRARYDSGSGSDTLRFEYTVQRGDYDADGVSVELVDGESPFILDGAAIRAVADDEAVDLIADGSATFPGGAQHKVDGRVAQAVAASISSSPASGSTYGTGETITVRLAMNEAVLVTGRPHVLLNVGAARRQAVYIGPIGSATDVLEFSYAVQAGDFDADGVALCAGGPGCGSIQLDDGTIRAASDEADALLRHPALAAQRGHRVDATEPLPAPPTACSAEVTVPSDWALKPTGVASGGKFRVLFVTSNRRDARSTNIAHYNSFVQARAANGHAAIQNYGKGFRVLGSTQAVNARANTCSRSSDTDAAVYWLNGTKVADNYGDMYDGSWDSNADRLESGNSNTAVTSRVWTGTNNNGTTDSFNYLGGFSPAFGTSNSPTTPLKQGITTIGNYRLYGLSQVFVVDADRTTPATTDISISSNPGIGDTYRLGETVEVEVTYSEAVSVRGTPSVGLAVRSATEESDNEYEAAYVRGSGTTKLVFAFTVPAGLKDDDGIQLHSSALRLNGATITAVSDGIAAVWNLAAERNIGAKVDSSGSALTGGICDRTPPVRYAIVAAVTAASDCSQVTEEHLAALTGTLTVNGLTSVAAGDFAGLSGITGLTLTGSGIETLPAGLLDGLGSLTGLGLQVGLTRLPKDYFRGLGGLTGLDLSGNRLAAGGLPDGIFEPLTKLTTIDLAGNPGSASFKPIADAGPGGTLSAGQTVSLGGPGTAGGPWGSNVTYEWEQTDGSGNPVSTVTLSATDAARPGFMVPALASATGVKLALVVSGKGDGSLLYAATSLAEFTIRGLAPTGLAVVSKPVDGTEFYRQGETIEVAVTFGDRVLVDTSLGTPTLTLVVGAAGPLARYVRGSGTTRLVFAHTVVANDTDSDGISALADRLIPKGGVIASVYGAPAILTHDALAAQSGHKVDGTTPVGGICGRTPQLRDKLLALVKAKPGNSGIANCSAVMPEVHLPTLTNVLDLRNAGIATLKRGDFANLGGIASLRLNGNGLTALPAGTFEGLDDTLTSLSLSGNDLQTIAAGVFDPLIGLTSLALNSNDLSSLPPRVFEKLINLTLLDLVDNPGSADFVPIAKAGPEGGIDVVSGGGATLGAADAENGYDDPWGTNVKRSWTLPAGTTVTYDVGKGADTARPSFTAPATGGTLTFTLTVTGKGASTDGRTNLHRATSTVNVHVGTAGPLPMPVSAVVDGETLTLTYNEALQVTDSPPASAPGKGPVYLVVVSNIETAALSAVEVTGRQVILTLKPEDAADLGETVTLSYYPDNATAASKVRDLGDNLADAFVGLRVDNDTPEGNTVQSFAVTGPAKTYRIGDTIGIEVTFSEPVTVTGAPTLALEIGTARRKAAYVGGSGSAVLTFEYTPVALGEEDTDGIAVEANGLEVPAGSSILNTADREAAILRHRRYDFPAHKVDGVLPTATAASAAGPTVTVTWSEALDEASVPAGAGGFTVRIGNANGPAVSAVAVSGSTTTLSLASAIADGTANVTLEYTPPRSGSKIRDAAGNDAAAIPRDDALDVTVTPDQRAPEVSGRPTVDGTTLTLTFDEALDTASVPAAPGGFTVAVTRGGSTVSGYTVSALSLSPNGRVLTLTLSEAVRGGDTVTLAYAKPSTRPLQDRAATPNAVADFTGADAKVVDNRTPSVKGAPVFAGAAEAYAIGDRIAVEVEFTQAVSVTTTSSARPEVAVTVGANTRKAVYVSGSGSARLRFEYAVVAGDADGDGIAIPANALAAPAGSAIRTAAGSRAVQLGHDAVGADPARTVDGVLPRPTAAAAEGLTVVVTWSEALDPASAGNGAGGFRVKIGTGNGPAVTAVAVDGTDATKLRLTLADRIADGTQNATLEYRLPSETKIRDAAGNGALAFTGSDAVAVSVTPDTTAPMVAGAAVDGARLTLTFDEPLDEASVPAAPGGFTVTVTRDGNAVPGHTVTGIAVSGATVTLTLAQGVLPGDTVTLDYVPTSTRLQDRAATPNPVAGFSGLDMMKTVDNASDALEVSLSTTEAVEGADGTVTLTVAVAGGGTSGVARAIAIAPVASPTAAETEDWTLAAAARSLTLGAGQRSAAAAIAVVDDARLEGEETVSFAVTADGAAIGQVTLTIADDDKAVLAVRGPAQVTEGQPIELTLRLEPHPENVANVSAVPDDACILDFPVTATLTRAGDTAAALPSNPTLETDHTFAATGFDACTREVTVSVPTRAPDGDWMADRALTFALAPKNSDPRVEAGAALSAAVRDDTPPPGPMVEGIAISPGARTCDRPDPVNPSGYTKEEFLALPGCAVHGRGTTLTFTLTFDSAVTVTPDADTRALPELVLDVFGREGRAQLSGNRTDTGALTFTWTVAKGDNDPDGIRIASIDLKGARIRFAAGCMPDLPCGIDVSNFESDHAQRYSKHLVRGGLYAMWLDVSGSAREGEPFTVTVRRGGDYRETAHAIVRMAGLLRDLVDAVRADTAPPAGALGLVNLTTLPVYRVANAAAAYRGAVIDQEMNALAEAVALDVMQVWITDLHRTVEERAGTLDIADGEQLRKWREGLRANRVALARHRHQGLQRLNTALAVVEKLRLIETELAGALSAELRAALAFARGGAGAGSR